MFYLPRWESRGLRSCKRPSECSDKDINKFKHLFCCQHLIVLLCCWNHAPAHFYFILQSITVSVFGRRLQCNRTTSTFLHTSPYTHDHSSPSDACIIEYVLHSLAPLSSPVFWNMQRAREGQSATTSTLKSRQAWRMSSVFRNILDPYGKNGSCRHANKRTVFVCVESLFNSASKDDTTSNERRADFHLHYICSRTKQQLFSWEQIHTEESVPHHHHLNIQ